MKLTKQQIENWKLAFPMLQLLDDEQIQIFRDNIQRKVNSERPELIDDSKSKHDGIDYD